MISVEQAIYLSKKLAEKVSEDFLPDVVILIKNGGVLPGIEISKYFRCDLKEIEVRRSYDDSIMKKYQSASKEERVIIANQIDDTFLNTEPVLLEAIDCNIEDKNVLLVDDAVHTGKTFSVAVEYLKTLKPKSVKTAGLYYVLEENTPDYFLGKGEKKYPWSTWAQYEDDYDTYKQYLNDNNK